MFLGDLEQVLWPITCSILEYAIYGHILLLSFIHIGFFTENKHFNSNVPSYLISTNRQVIFNSLPSRIYSKAGSWSSLGLQWAGRPILIRFVALAMPLYIVKYISNAMCIPCCKCQSGCRRSSIKQEYENIRVTWFSLDDLRPWRKPLRTTYLLCKSVVQSLY